MFERCKKNVYKLTEEDRKKYIGSNDPIYRSSWEERVMYYFCNNKNIIKWNSERVIIPYLNKLDGKIHRYYVDFYCEVVDKSGILNKYIVEVKPKKQCIPPKLPKRQTTKSMRRYKYEVGVYIINQCKWEAAKKYAESKGWKFIIITEDQLNLI